MIKISQLKQKELVNLRGVDQSKYSKYNTSNKQTDTHIKEQKYNIAVIFCS